MKQRVEKFSSDIVGVYLNFKESIAPRSVGELVIKMQKSGISICDAQGTNHDVQMVSVVIFGEYRTLKFYTETATWSVDSWNNTSLKCNGDRSSIFLDSEIAVVDLSEVKTEFTIWGEARKLEMFHFFIKTVLG